ncbi:MAG: ABC transporter ATP-binding protein [Armatimonadota bacterium]
MTPKPVLELKNINKQYGKSVVTKVLKNINLKVYSEEFVSVVGSSGSGKTTLLNILGLLDTPTSGEVIIGGKNAASLSEDERAMNRRNFLGFIFQFHYLLSEFTVLENAMMPCLLSGSKCDNNKKEKMIELLERVGLGDRLHYKPSELSGGQQQRVAVVRALANEPTIVLADEPTGNLDSKSGQAVIDLMKELNEYTGTSFLMVTHDKDFASQTKKTIHLVDGTIEDNGS